MSQQTTIERLALRDDGLVPNNPKLDLQLYRGAFDKGGRGAAERIIAHFAANGWSGAWINGIYPYHHYHATQHEVLGIASGWAEVQLGGPAGPIVRVEAGDVVLIPAGVGHCRISESDDLSVVGAYPGGASTDTQRATPEARVASLPKVARVAKWPRDPVTGE